MKIEKKESEIQREIMDWLKMQPSTYFWKTNSVGIPDPKYGFRKNYSAGVSDICGLKRGKFFAFEVKSKNGRLSDKQEKFLKAVDLAGGYACVVRSLRDAQQAFGEI